MSASQTPPGSNAGAAAGAAAGNDPSMEDILASIRRILSEDEAPAGTAAPAAGDTKSADAGDDVLVLDPTMMVHEAPPVPEPPPPPEPAVMAMPPPAEPG